MLIFSGLNIIFYISGEQPDSGIYSAADLVIRL